MEFYKVNDEVLVNTTLWHNALGRIIGVAYSDEPENCKYKIRLHGGVSFQTTKWFNPEDFKPIEVKNV